MSLRDRFYRAKTHTGHWARPDTIFWWTLLRGPSRAISKLTHDSIAGLKLERIRNLVLKLYAY
jgi:hypothetical protein